MGARRVTHSPFLTLEEAAQYLRVSPATLGDQAREGLVPHRKNPGARRLLFIPHELDACVNGAPLEVTHLPRGGRVVRPKPQRNST
jgi:hypothetical protein